MARRAILHRTWKLAEEGLEEKPHDPSKVLAGSAQIDLFSNEFFVLDLGSGPGGIRTLNLSVCSQLLRADRSNQIEPRAPNEYIARPN